MVATLERIPFVLDALTGAGVGALIGSWVAYQHGHRGGRLPYDWIVTRWSAGGAGLALLLGAAAELL